MERRERNQLAAIVGARHQGKLLVFRKLQYSSMASTVETLCIENAST